MKKEDFLKVISEKDNDQEVNELIGEIEEHVFRYIKYGTRSNVFNLVEACYDAVSYTHLVRRNQWYERNQKED